jgi:hypothetical protein
MAILENVGIVLVKDEGATYGVDSAPTEANAVKLSAIPQFNLNQESAERTKLNSAASTGEPIIGPSHWDIVLQFEVKGSGTAGTAPEADPLWESAGFLGVNVALTSETYKPSIASKKSCTISWYANGLLYKATGCRGNISIAADANGVLQATWTGKGLYVAPSDSAMVASPVYDATDGVPLVSGVFSYGSYSACLRALSLEMGIGVNALQCIGGTKGISSIELDRFNITGNMTIGHILVATRAVENLTVLGGSVAMSLAVGATAGNITTITSSKLRKTAVSKTSNGGQLDLAVDFKLSESASLNDDITIAFT